VEGHLGGGYEQGLFSGVQLVKLLNQRMNKPVELLVVGDVPAEIRIQAESISSSVVWRGVVKREEIPALDRSAHLFYSSDVNAACPNSVIEALACGLPVTGFDTGALPELVPSSVGRIAKYGGDVWNLDKPNIYALADGAHAVLRDIENLRKGARKFAEENFDIDQITSQYLKVLFPE
jgi:glycosyltransferase involved in cell wall biosynthesis